ncbi:putative two-component histidine kinase [Flavihumibacter petaseus NBRC 106054]|uniref:histidine kinase n=2 Tax=Flavihumibacter TaxID=1004301 RepID=A0A0E9N2D0_9BACT|nr:putative two-component histidine kinase [Flavihumibacter petaseus NBRC 106054]
MEFSIDGMVAINTENIVVAWNTAAARLLGASQDQAVGFMLFQVLPGIKNDSDLMIALQHSRSGLKSFLAPDPGLQHRRHVEIHIIPLQADGVFLGTMLLIHDVAHRLVKEQELQRVNAALEDRLRQLHLAGKEVAQLTHLATHDIRGPIRDIYTLMEGLMRQEASAMSNYGKASFRRIQSSLNRMSLLIDDIVALSQITIADVPERCVNLEELVAALAEQFNRKLQETGTLLTTGDLLPIRAHEKQLELLLQQLLRNMIHFSARSSPHIHIETKMMAPPRQLDGTERQGEVRLSITHNSTAFSDVEQVNSFQAEQPVNGPAIALTIAGKIMTLHKGALHLERIAGNKMIVHCFFPV